MRAALAVFGLLGLIAGCSDSPTKPATKSSSVLGAKDKDSGKQDPLPTKSDEKAIALVEQAIKAHGGVDALGQLAAVDRSVKGVVIRERREVEFSSDTQWQLPDRLRLTFSQDLGETKRGKTLILNGKEGWEVELGQPEPLLEPMVQELQEKMYAFFALPTLLPLRDSDLFLTSAGEADVEGKPASVIRAVAKDRPDVKLYFDKASNLLVKIAYRATLGGGQGEMELRLLDYKDVDGAKVAYHQIEYIGGNTSTSWTLTNIRVARKFDAALFSKP